jgi:hypothetical protein
MSHRVLSDTVRKETSTLEELSVWASVLWQKVERQFQTDGDRKGHRYKTAKGAQHSASLIFASDGD